MCACVFLFFSEITPLRGAVRPPKARNFCERGTRSDGALLCCRVLLMTKRSWGENRAQSSVFVVFSPLFYQYEGVCEVSQVSQTVLCACLCVGSQELKQKKKKLRAFRKKETVVSLSRVWKGGSFCFVLGEISLRTIFTSVNATPFLPSRTNAKRASFDHHGKTRELERAVPFGEIPPSVL